MSLSRLYSKKTQSSYNATAPLDRDPPEYPGDAFKKSRNKPTLTRPKSNLSLDDARCMIKGQIQNGSVDIELAKHYLILVLEQITEDNSDDWTSFGVQILSRTERGRPLCMVNIQLDDKDKTFDSQVKDSTATVEDDLWMTTYLLAIYRIGRATNKNYQTQLIDELNKLLATFPGDYVPMVQALQAFDSWPNDPNYCKLVACVDMFFSRFKKSKWAILRFGTISSRYRDCAALTALNHFSRLLGVDLVDALEWSFVGRVSDEIEQMLKPDQELDKVDSYTPYMIDLGISKASPYSTVRNPAWHLFCHTVGSLMMSRRSINARHLEAPDQSNILSNAELIVFVFETRIKWLKNFRKLDSVDASDQLDQVAPVVLGTKDLPNTTNADDWFSWMKLNNFELPDECGRYVSKLAKKLKDSREGSVGQFVYLRLGD
ncbi:nucleocapsid protein [Tupaia virus]|uniref:Nucleoprotein n=1 Tax=Tupaia virus (isolate Tupaia/Thailand/-/1986) TaxID=1560034 RepID=NCAP_TUPVT|nr:nucleocapsid protein [Tupaia virus]Q4VKV8.1 RecName: Full=Nucleoprotein; Short=NP; AltName: Full=Nucleocapsid protein; Short=Protein N [Tupaia virus isolate Tupaia/Thailand/-/1986]AAX47596.1 nucleocapsid protein [Tupaia virus]